MSDRFRMWLSASMVSAGVVAALLAGAGTAAADDAPSSDDKGATSAESAKPAENKADSDTESGTPKPKPADDEAQEATVDEPTGQPSAQPPAEKPTNGKKSKTTKKALPKPAKPAAAAEKPAAAPSREQAEPQPEKPEPDKPEPEKPATVTEPVVEVSAAVVPLSRTATKAEPVESAAVAVATPVAAEITSTATASPLSGLLSAIGTIVFGIYGLATQILGGPPILPPGSTVTVRTSTLHLDCGCNSGDGVDVQADWYVPKTAEGAPAPDRLIYLQHGFLARGPWYSYTAAALAEQTRSIVVAPSITSNFLASDACWLGGSAMHESMARLFDDGNTALADSAAAAGYSGAIPDRVVLIGHSLGGGAVIGIAGAMAGKESEQRLAGVIMLDGVPFDRKAAEKIGDVDDSIPIYNLAAPRYFWNQFGVGTDALLAARPGTFIGVTLAGGSHVDSMRGGNPLIQFGQELVAGFVRPQNGDAAQILMIDWANEMFDGIQRGPITDPFTIDTPSGVATAVPLPNSLTKPFILNPLQSLVSLGTGYVTIEPACVQESMAASTCTSESIAA
ncbi:hypothetical protein A5724_19965 [Mycobacterium sp. ACS1612]|uniref:hypothetical protein n=1 Tax=Mycobacterium sp. ACS1612 TaxID=1834117 RepID=UPI0007FEE12F|nr:hypothetical protein [Mycobacterium sp. ACS1612]OBF32921.1 hypothetical protein A5724_19965 [Mycobacterium sp. ACS1612]